MRPIDDWIYLMIYPGSMSHLDLVVQSIVGPLVRRFDGRFKRWFFIRYIDEHGPHVRLRFQGDSELLQTISHEAETWVKPCLQELRSRPAMMAGRLIPLGNQESRSGTVDLRYGTYEPEYDKYGGTVGVEIAEEFFEASSRLVTRLYADQVPTISERAVLAVKMMAVVAETGIRKPARRNEFWKWHHLYWSSNGAYVGDDFRERLRTSADKRRTVIEHQISALSAHPAVQDLIANYTQSAQTALRRATKERVTVSPADLCFHYIHMTNNRLGILPLEEAYLSCFMVPPGAETTGPSESSP